MIWFVLIMTLLTLGGSVWLNVFVIRKNLQLADQRENLVDTIEESLDVLESCYDSIRHNSELPVLSDEPVIREVMADIKRAKNAVLAIAGQIVIYDTEKGASGANNT